MNIIEIICPLLAFYVTLCLAQKDNKECNLRVQQKVDTHFGRILTIGTYRKMPENVGQLRRYCQENIDMLNVIQNYTDKCLEHLPKQVSSVFIYTEQKHIFDTICKKDSKQRRDLFRASPCANAATNEFVKCHHNLIDAMVALKSAKDDRYKLPFICCEYWKVRACMVQSAKRVEDCDHKKVDTILKYVDLLTDNVMDLLCGGFEEGTDKCQKLGDAPRQALTRLTRAKSFLFPVIQMLKDFPRIQG